ncbi:restriction endonuclease subunit S [Ligilactobacillus ruminis]|uniref:restriction endonuclease subunit S n=2 Tax=Ligilactobacillus ruminis TaxID=1623 RepID=UPI003B9D9755
MNRKKESKVVPNVRFKGFTDDWKQRKLGDVSEIIGGGTPSTNHPEYWDGDIDWYSPAEILDQIYVKRSQRRITKLGYDNSSAKLLPPGTVLFTSRAGIGKTAILSQKSCTNQGFQSIVPHENELDTYFIFSRTNALKRYGELVGAGSTFAEVSGKQMSAMNLMLPTTIQEQQVIGQFFKKLDRLITLHQQKITLLTKLKKAMLEKMFPKKGSVIPEFRFNGFANAWEQRKLENFGKATGGTSIESEFSEDGIYKVISIGSYSENSVYNDQGIRAIKSDKTSNRVLNKNDLTMILNDKTTSGNIIGRVLLIEKSGIYVYNQRTERIEININEYDPVFLYEMLNAPNIREKIIKQAQGNTQIYVNWSTIAMLDYMIPSKKEQVKIGQFLHSISNIITLYQRKIDKIKNMKKAMLDQMFI